MPPRLQSITGPAPISRRTVKTSLDKIEAISIFCLVFNIMRQRLKETLIKSSNRRSCTFWEKHKTNRGEYIDETNDTGHGRI